MSNLINTQNSLSTPKHISFLFKHTHRMGGKKSIPHHYFIKDTVAVWSDDPRREGGEQQHKDDAKTDALWTILPIVELSSLVLGMDKHAEHM